MFPASCSWWFQLATALGTLVLAVPVFRLDLDRALLQKLKELLPSENRQNEDSSPPLAGLGGDDGAPRKTPLIAASDEKAQNLVNRTNERALAGQQAKVDNWTPFQRQCLWAGYLLVFLGSFGALLTTPPAG